MSASVVVVVGIFPFEADVLPLYRCCASCVFFMAFFSPSLSSFFFLLFSFFFLLSPSLFSFVCRPLFLLSPFLFSFLILLIAHQANTLAVGRSSCGKAPPKTATLTSGGKRKRRRRKWSRRCSKLRRDMARKSSAC